MRALVAEGQPATRLGLVVLLREAGIDVVGDYASVAETVARMSETRPDVALIDLCLPDVPGSDAVTRLLTVLPALPIVAFSAIRSGPAEARSAFRAGARGFIRKDAPPERIVAALRAVVTGLTAADETDGALYIAPRPEFPLVSRERSPLLGGPATTPIASEFRETLTAREIDLLRCLAEGQTNKEIAKVMALAEDTVKKAVQTLIAKLGATDRTHAVVLALRDSIID